jgi:hypothetical protein
MNDKLQATETARKIVNSGLTFGVILGIYTLWISRDHITHIGYAIGLGGFEAQTLFLLVDFIAVYGKVLTNRKLSAKTRRIGKQGLLTGLGLSLVCNVMSGLIKGGIIPADLAVGGVGAAIYGVFIVAMLVWIEHAVSNTKAKASTTERRAPRAPKAPAEALTPRQIAARKGAETKRRNAAMPVSPATVAEIDSIIA